MDSMTDSKSGSGQTTAGQTPSYSIYPLWDQKYFSDPLAWIWFLLGYSFVLVGSGVADFRWQNWNTTEAVQPSTPRVPSTKSTVDVHNQQTGKMYTGPGEPEKLSGHQSSSYPYEFTHLPTRRTLSELRAPTRTHLYSFPCVTHIIYWANNG